MNTSEGSPQQYPRGSPVQGCNGHKVRSKFEASIELQLKGLGITPEYEPGELSYTCSYVPDFRLPNGVYLECKGYFSDDDRSKMLKVKQSNPKLDIRMIFMVDNKLHSGSKMRYSDWCLKHGFRFAFKSVPPAWILEDLPSAYQLENPEEETDDPF